MRHEQLKEGGVNYQTTLATTQEYNIGYVATNDRSTTSKHGRCCALNFSPLLNKFRQCSQQAVTTQRKSATVSIGVKGVVNFSPMLKDVYTLLRSTHYLRKLCYTFNA